MHEGWCHNTENASSSSASATTAISKLETILDAEVPEKYTLTDHLWNYLQAYAAKHKVGGNGFGFNWELRKN